MWRIGLLLLLLVGCGRGERAGAPRGDSARSEAAVPGPAAPAGDAAPDRWTAARHRLVEDALVARGVTDERLLAAMRRVPRHELVPETLRDRAYEDRPLPIGWEQTISQPYVVAMMTEAARVGPGDRVLEVGTGSGYQAAVLAEMGAEVYSIEIVEPLARHTAEVLRRLGYERIQLRIGDGYRGWPEAAPFAAILVTAAPSQVPRPLLEQLAVGGRLVIPVGPQGRVQQLRVITRTADGTTSETIAPVRFVPMTGEAERDQSGAAPR
jgi:protein-L-isoaspartate(D-aspartate) O-methyltransferase